MSSLEYKGVDPRDELQVRWGDGHALEGFRFPDSGSTFQQEIQLWVHATTALGYCFS